MVYFSEEIDTGQIFTRIPLEAGDVMIFDGSTTYHGNLPIAADAQEHPYS